MAHDTPEPVFSEKDVRRILRRAAALQQETAAETTGLTLEELQQVAAEVGIDPRFIAMAAAEAQAAETDAEPFHLFGGGLSILEERSIPGRLTEAQREEMLAEIRRTYHQAGTASRVGRTTDWTHSANSDEIQVTITERRDRTIVRVLERFPRLAILSYVIPLSVLIPFAVNVPLVFGLSTLPTIAFMLLILLASFFGSRLIYSGINKRKQRKARRLLKRLAHIAAEPEAEPEAAPAPALPEAGRLDASLLDAEAPDTAPPTSATREKTRN